MRGGGGGGGGGEYYLLLQYCYYLILYLSSFGVQIPHLDFIILILAHSCSPI